MVTTALPLAAPPAERRPGAVVHIGVDVGQQVDPTAIVVAEPEIRRVGGRDENHWIVRLLERLPLGTKYPAVAARVAEVTAAVAARSGRPVALFVDATGVGKPVVDELERGGVRARMYAVYFTHGDRRTQEGLKITLGKAYLVSRLQTLLQGKRLHLPRTATAERLAKELQDYEIRIEANGNDTYGAFKVGSHDDLVTALGLAVQYDRPARGAV